MRQLTPSDAQMYWLSRRIPNDQFLLYCFDETNAAPKQVREAVLGRARAIDALCVRVHEVAGHLDYPYWSPRAVDADQIVEHELAAHDWRGFEARLAQLLSTVVDARVSPWLLHLFRGIEGAPGCPGRATIAVLQISHAAADGRGASAIARELFAPNGSDVSPRSATRPPELLLTARAVLRLPWRFAATLVQGVRASQARRRLAELTQRGDVPAEHRGYPLTRVNAAPGPQRSVRMIVTPRDTLRGEGITVTLAVLTAISIALAQYLDADGAVGAEVTIATTPAGQGRNNFRHLGIDLCTDVPDLRRRAAGIADELAARRTRAEHPLAAAQSAVIRALPAPAMWHEISRYRLHEQPQTVSGNTVVSSVYRGAADLRLAGAPVRFTAGFPALSPVMGLTHGVHGIGDVVTVSITTSPAVMPDVDRYEALLRGALEEVATAVAR